MIRKSKSATPESSTTQPDNSTQIPRRGRHPKPVVEFPESLVTDWIDVTAFHEALRLHISRHGDTVCHLHKALTSQGEKFERSALLKWAAGTNVLTSIASLAILGRIERRYRLPVGYFKSKLLNRCRAPSGHRKLSGITPSERRRLAWHLPDDFDSRPAKERKEILEWVRTVVISGATDYRRYQAEAAKYRYAIRFPELTGRSLLSRSVPDEDDESRFLDEVELDLTAVAMDAPRDLADEMAGLIRFKIATLTDIGFQRSGVWNESTAFQKIEHLELLFGALAAAPRGRISGLSVPSAKLAMGLRVFRRSGTGTFNGASAGAASSRPWKSTCCSSVSR